MAKLRLRDLHRGDVYIMWDIHRICRVGEEVDVERVDGKGLIDTHPGRMMYVTIPAVPIEGFLTAQQATGNAAVIANIAADNPTASPATDDTNWKEVWTERTVPFVDNTGDGGAAKIHEDRHVPQLYVHQEIGKLGVRAPGPKEQGMAARGQVQGLLVPAELVPPGMFRDYPEATLPPTPLVPGPDLKADAAMVESWETPPPDKPESTERRGGLEPTPAKPKRVTIATVRAKAKAQGIDVSDISGTGALKKILARLEEKKATVA